ncbi:YfhO family protein [Ignavigranum ruoffiae]
MSRKHKILIGSTLLPMLIMLIGWVINDYYPFGNKSLMAIDFSQQFIDLYVSQKRALLSGDFTAFFYSFSKSIGGNMVGSWAYYLFSPFNLFYILLPTSMIVEAVFCTVIFRYGLIGFAMAYFLIKRHRAVQYSPYLTISLATIYTLNGYNVSYQMVPIFYDAMWMLPFILIGLEELLDGGKPYKYCLLLAFMIFIQFYMGYMICIFIVLYSIFYLIWQKKEQKWRDYLPKILPPIGRLAFYSILAVLLTSAVFVPNVLNLIESKAAGANSLKFAWELQIEPLDILAKLNIGAFDSESWPFGPNLPNIYVASLGLVGALYYFMTDKIRWSEKLAAFFVILVFFVSIVHEFTSKLWHMGQNPAGFFYRFSWLLAFFLVFLAYRGLKDASFKAYQVLFGLAAILLMQAYVFQHDFSFLTSGQKYVSTALFILIWLLLYFLGNRSWQWLLVLLISAGELGANAVISQGRINYSDAYKFQNAVQVIDEAIDPIRPNHQDFYRISKSFTRSKNDPMMFDYPGLTHFSSSLEVSTRKLLEHLGSNAVDASTTYIGTPLTDGLFAVKYFIQNHPYDTGSTALNEKTYFFGNDVTRKDLTRADNFVSATERFETYQVPASLPLGFGVSDQLIGLELKANQPVQNQELIMQSLAPSDQAYATLMAPNTVEMDNLKVREVNGRKYYQRIDSSQEGRLRWKFIPQSNGTYFASVPLDLSTREDDFSFAINGEKLAIRKKFVADQLFNLADQVQGQEQSFEVIFKTDKEVDLSRLYLARFDRDAIYQLLKSKEAEGWRIDSWGNNQVKGQVTLEGDSQWLFTSIPYDEGWQVKVDGKAVNPVKVWDALLAVRMSPGTHQVEMVYYPKGFLIGVGLSVLSLLLFIYLARSGREKDWPSRQSYVIEEG